MTALLNIFASVFHSHALGWPRTRRWRNSVGVNFRNSYQACVVCGAQVPYHGPLE